MSTQAYRVQNFRADSLRRIRLINNILEEYDGQRLTARQVYYRLVAGGHVENTPRSYQNLTSLLTDARYAGLVDWDIIEDRGREPDVPSEWESVDRIVDVAVRTFRLPRWRDQPRYVELWVEKQALAGVLSPIAERFHVPMSVNKGYSSASAMKAAADRMLEALLARVEIQCDGCGSFWDPDTEGLCNSCGDKTKPVAVALNSDGDTEFEKQVVVLYLGDHDPSGEDMVRDIRERLEEFGVPNLTVFKLALTMEQVRQYNPPPNPAKLTDSRATGYIKRFGTSSWELDAIPPRDLNRLVERAIEALVDRPKMDAVIAEEQRQREAVTAALEVVRAVSKKPKPRRTKESKRRRSRR